MILFALVLAIAPAPATLLAFSLATLLALAIATLLAFLLAREFIHFFLTRVGKR